MARSRVDRTSALALDAITVEGALISSAMLARISQHKADAQTDADYGVPKGLSLRDEIARVETDIARKNSHKTAADAFFRKP